MHSLSAVRGISLAIPMARNCLLIAAEAPSSSDSESSEEEKEAVPGVWDHLKDVLPLKDLQRLERDAVERAKEEEKEKKAVGEFYLGKPDMRPSWDGGGWGGPKDGHDMDQRFMLRGEARELPDYIYAQWKFHRSDDRLRLQASDAREMQQKMQEKIEKKKKKEKKEKKLKDEVKAKKVKKEKKKKEKKEKKEEKKKKP